MIELDSSALAHVILPDHLQFHVSGVLIDWSTPTQSFAGANTLLHNQRDRYATRSSSTGLWSLSDPIDTVCHNLAFPERATQTTRFIHRLNSTEWLKTNPPIKNFTKPAGFFEKLNSTINNYLRYAFGR